MNERSTYIRTVYSLRTISRMSLEQPCCLIPHRAVDSVREALVRLQVDSADRRLAVHPRSVVERTMIWTELEACSRQVSRFY